MRYLPSEDSAPLTKRPEDSGYEIASYQQGAKKRGYTKRPVTAPRKDTAVFGFLKPPERLLTARSMEKLRITVVSFSIHSPCLQSQFPPNCIFLLTERIAASGDEKETDRNNVIMFRAENSTGF